MLPAPDLTEILTNLAALNLQPETAAAVLGAVLTPLLRGSDSDPVRKRRHKHAGRPRSTPRRRKNLAASDRHTGRGRRPTATRARARVALKASPDASLSAVARAAGCSRGTVKQARADLAAEGLEPAAKPAKPPSEPRQRAQRFLKDTLAHGPKRVTDVEEAAAKAHIDEVTLGQARADLGVITSRANTGNTLSVQWSLPG